ncbi:MAG: asparaginase [Pseudomonadota bacterium]
MHSVPLVDTTRGYPDRGFTVENVHMGSVAVTDRAGKLLWYAGNPDQMSFTRSALKPFQALPFVLADGPARLGLSQGELAMLCASHSGEDKHVQAVQAILSKIGMDESHLACGCHAPTFYEHTGQPVPQDRRWNQLHHNCSGKHSGFLSWCRLHDVPSARYVDPGHQLQQEVRRTLAMAAGMQESDMPMGMDGCSAPNYGMPLSRLAYLYARLAQGRADPVLGGAMGDLAGAMTAHPDLVSGTARSDLAYMRAGGGDWVAKVGADAVQTLGIRSAGLGIAIKIADGAMRALPCATYSVLDQLGLLDEGRRGLLAAYREPAIKSIAGATVGHIRAVFTLQRAA